MIEISKTRLEQLFEGFCERKIAVIGDLMLDRYLWGEVARISPEAPVPVVEISEETERLGGAANVAHNIHSLGAVPLIIGVVGDDNSGLVVRNLFKQLGFTTEGLFSENQRPTTVKTRVIAHSQHVVRTDREVRQNIGPQIEDKILNYLRDILDRIDGIILQDYNKGVLTKKVIAGIIGMGRMGDKIITADPKFNNFFQYRDVTLVKPNLRETEGVLGCRVGSDEDLRGVGNDLVKRLNCPVLITQGERGMTLFEKGGRITQVPTTAMKIHDVSGAGDTVIGTLTVALASGASLKEAATIANYAAGIVCGEVGIVPVDREKLFEMLMGRAISSVG